MATASGGTDGQPGAQGLPGNLGANGPAGNSGAGGANGSVNVTQRLGTSDVCDGMKDEPQVHSSLQQFYNSLTSNDPFPAEEPPPSALPDCPPPDPPPASRQGALDVAFGDSYMSGEGAPSFDTSAVTAPGGPSCHDALTAWSALVYNVPLPTTDNQVSFQNWACTGATIAAVQTQISNAITAAANPGTIGPQGLGKDTHSVQVTVVGNDLGFATDLTCAVTHGATASNKTRTRDNNGNLCIPDDGPMTAAANAQQSRLVAVYQQIVQAAPNAIIEVAAYPIIFPTDERKCTTGVTKADEVQANSDFNIVDNMIAAAVNQAAASGVNIRYLAFNTALAHANVCPTGSGNTHGVNVPGNNESASGIQGLFHPNRAGHQALQAAYARQAASRFSGGSVQAAPALANGTLVSDESSDSVYVAAGGALFGFINPADVTGAGYPAGFGTLALTPGQIGGLPADPANGTLLKDASTGTVYSIACGQKTPSGTSQGSVTVPSHDLADIPDAAPAACPGLFYWQAPGGSFSTAANQVSALPGMATSPTAVGHNNGDHAAHAFSVDPDGHLWDSFTSDALSGNSFTVTDISSQTGATVLAAAPVGALYLGGNNPSTQVFALSPSGALLSFTTLGDGQASGNTWQVFNLSSFSNSSAILATNPAPIQFGSTVHVYATDTAQHLHDFYKTLTGNWQDIDLTGETGVPSSRAQPYAYGGNSIQTVTTSSAGDLLTVIQTVNPDGTIDFSTSPGVFDITQLSGGSERASGTPRPVVTGDNTVNIFVDDTGNRLVDFTKAPSGPWQVSTIATVGQANMTPSPVWDPSAGLHVVTSNNAGQLTDYSTTSTAPPFSSSILPAAGAPAVGDPSMVAIAQPSTALVTFSEANCC